MEPLKWSREDELERIERRYERCTRHLADVLPRLLESSEFREVVATLLGEGWKHWHILWALFTVLFNRHAEAAGLGSPEGTGCLMQETMDDEGLLGKLDGQNPTPPAFLTVERMKLGLDSGVAAFLTQLGYPPRAGRGYSIGSFTKIAADRFQFMTLDVDHQCPLDTL